MTVPARRYQVLHPIGKGAFGTVYRAKLLSDAGFEKDVALKLLNSDLENVEDLAARQRDEARLLGLIQHRAIVKVDGLVRLDGRWAIVMEFVDGVNLHQLRKRVDIPPSCAVAILREVAGALKVATAAKSLQLVHRDIKPSNVQLTRTGEVKLLDFGVAKATFEQREAKSIGMVLGTLRYLAPERYLGVDTPAADVFALGAVFIELITGESLPKSPMKRSLFPGYLAELEARLVAATGPNLPQELVRLPLDCLNPDAGERPSAAEVASRAWELERELAAPRLEDWAPKVVERVQSDLKIGSVQLDEPMILTEAEPDNPTLQTALPLPRRQMGPTRAATLGAAGMLAVVLLTAGMVLVGLVIAVILMGTG